MYNKVKRRKPSTKSKSAWKIVIFTVIALLVCLIGVAAAYIILYKPEIKIPINPFGTDTAEQTDIEVETNSPDDSPAIYNDYTNPSYDTRIEDKYNILVMGRDKVALNTDVIMVVSYDVAKGTLSILQIPRDTYMDGRKINSLYAVYYNEAYQDGASDPYYTAMEKFSQAVQFNFNIVIDRFVLVNLEGFRNIIDIIGGVHMDVPFDMDYNDPDQDLYIHIKAGQQVLDGETAEGFVRFRHGFVEGDIGRVNAQKLFITALIAEVKDSISISTVSGIVDQVIKNVVTSCSVSDCVYFAKNALSLDLANITMMTLPGHDERAEINSGAWYYIMYRADTLAMINKYLNVFTTDITDSIFDRNRVFTDSTRPHIDNLYYTESSDDPDSYKASDIINGDIPDIPLT